MALKLSRPLVYTLVGAAVVAAVVFLTEPEAAPKKSAKAPAKAKSKTKQDVYTKEDFQAKFEPVNLQVRDAFKPLVARRDSRNTALSIPGGIPVAFTDGDPNWVYTGNVEVNGTQQAMLENTVTGEGVFLSRGERWKSMAILGIGSDTLRLEGPDGLIKTVTLGDRGERVAPEGGETPVAPVLPGAPLAGPIGGQGLTITPDPGVRTDAGSSPTREGRRRNGN